MRGRKKQGPFPRCESSERNGSKSRLKLLRLSPEGLLCRSECYSLMKPSSISRMTLEATICVCSVGS